MIGLRERWSCQLHVGPQKFFASILSHRGTCGLRPVQTCVPRQWCNTKHVWFCACSWSVDRLQAQTAHNPWQCSNHATNHFLSVFAPNTKGFTAQLRCVCSTVWTWIYIRRLGMSTVESAAWVWPVRCAVRTIRFEFVDCSRLFGVTIIPTNMRMNAHFMLHYCPRMQACTSLYMNMYAIEIFIHRHIHTTTWGLNSIFCIELLGVFLFPKPCPGCWLFLCGVL